jgi:hypothetical protein
MHIKAGGKAVIIALVLAGAGFYANKAGYFEGKQTVAATAPSKIDIPTGDASSAPPPSTSVSIAKASSNGVIKVQTIAWNAMSGLSYANGAPTTAAGSLMDKRGLKVSIERQDGIQPITRLVIQMLNCYAI